MSKQSFDEKILLIIKDAIQHEDMAIKYRIGKALSWIKIAIAEELPKEDYCRSHGLDWTTIVAVKSRLGIKEG